MWALALSIFAGCKWLTCAAGPAVQPARTLAYLCLWPGMDARTFLAAPPPAAPNGERWRAAAATTAAGALLLWGAARMIPVRLELWRGWVGMIGLILVLHFGLFALLALAWQRAGVAAEPIMRQPLAAQSLGEFWGLRWNRGFNDLARRFVFQPLQARLGVAAATMATFLASGLIHDLVISVPARAGYGLPTAYFLVQGAGVLAQRSRAVRRAGLARGIAGRVFTLGVVALPAFWLFHPLFVRRVMLPFLAAIGAL